MRPSLMITSLLFIIVIFLGQTIYPPKYQTVSIHEAPAQTWDSPININSEQDLIGLDLDGNGTVEDPYIIEHLSFYSMHSCIAISNTISYVVIRECNLRSYKGFLINIINASNILVTDCVFYLTENLVRVRNSTNITFTNCITLNENETNISGSFEIFWSQDCNISGNIFSQCVFDITLSQYVLFENNVISGSESKVSFRDTINLTLKNNSFHDCGIILEFYEHDWVSPIITDDNLVNGKKLGYFYNITGLSIDGLLYGQIIISCCVGLNVTDGVFNNLDYAVYIYNSSQINLYGLSVNNNTLNGVLILYSQNCSVIRCNISSNIVGLSIDYSSFGIVSNNTFFYNLNAMFISKSSFIIVKHNVFAYGRNGLCILNNESKYNTIFGNTFWKILFPAIDNGNTNQWYYEKQGNYWDDYEGYGPYIIDYDYDVCDEYPTRICDLIKKDGVYIPVVCTIDIFSIILVIVMIIGGFIGLSLFYNRFYKSDQWVN